MNQQHFYEIRFCLIDRVQNELEKCSISQSFRIFLAAPFARIQAN